MEDYKLANIEKYKKTEERLKFTNQPSKIVKLEAFRKLCHYLASNNERVLDVGGGSGIWTTTLKEQGFHLEVYALDLSESMLKERDADDICVLGDMENMPFEDDFFDRVFFYASLHHVKNTEKALLEAQRVVKPGGHIVLYEPISLRLLLQQKNIESVPLDNVEFCFSIKYLLKIIEKLQMSLIYVYYQGVFKKIVPIKNNLIIEKISNQVDQFINYFSWLRPMAMLGNYAYIVVQKST